MTSVLISPTDSERELALGLERQGIRVITWPETKLSEPEDSLGLDQAIQDLFGYDWLILKNERAAEYFLRRFQLLNQPAATDDLRLLTIGESATDKLVEAQVHVDVSVDRFSAGKVFAAIESYLGNSTTISGLNFLVPNANISREAFEEQLENAGARIDSVTTYQTTPDRHKLTQIYALLIGGGIGCITFTRASGVEEFAQLFDSNDLSRLLRGVETACLNEHTADAASAFGLVPRMIRGGPAIPELAASISSLLR